MQTARLPYSEDSASCFAAWMHRKGAVLLDSGAPYIQKGRYDIFSYEPHCTLTTRGLRTLVQCAGREDIIQDQDPFDLVRQALGEPLPPAPHPFIGGAIGYFSYDLSRNIECIHDNRDEKEPLPSMVVGIYDWAVIVDHVARETWLVSAMRHEATRAIWPQLIRQFSEAPHPPAVIMPSFRLTGPVTGNMTREQYTQAFDRIQQYIREGDCYQINFAQRFTAPCEGNAWILYAQLRQLNPAPFGAFLNTSDAQILCSSPERFLLLKEGQVETKPIKGTRPRSSHPDTDAALAATLMKSDKDRSENLMIVDLLRNDLGKDCRPGSIQVPGLFELESYASVHHMVSTVTGHLLENRDALHLLRNSFPGGSITGAPKIRAMEIIAELEPHHRSIYCGSIGYISHDGSMDSNIAIRTLVHSHGSMRCWAGGGIVADSVAQQEYEECFHKAAPLLEIMNRFMEKTERP